MGSQALGNFCKKSDRRRSQATAQKKAPAYLDSALLSSALVSVELAPVLLLALELVPVLLLALELVPVLLLALELVPILLLAPVPASQAGH